MSTKYKYLFLKYIYDKLRLADVEKKLLEGNVGALDLSSDISKYFGLLNDVYEERLSGELRDKYISYMSQELSVLCSSEMSGEINSFIESTYKLLLFPDQTEKYYYYGPININYAAPSDSIVLGMYYNEFETDETYSDESHDKKMDIVVDCINDIQYNVAPQNNLKVAVIQYNEFTAKKKQTR